MDIRNKKAIILVELIFTILIVSLISIFSMTLLYNIYEKFANEYKKDTLKLDTLSSEILLDKVFTNAINMEVKSNELSFYKIDKELFNLGYYSRFVDLNSTYTTKSSIFSPNTKAEYLIQHNITFDDITFYTIKDDSYGEIINLDDTNQKTIKEQYKIVSKNHTLKCIDNKLYLNDNILLDKVYNCSFNKISDILNINLNVDNIVINWKFKL